MIRFPLLAIPLLTFSAASGLAQNQLDANPALFALMAALNATGYDTDADSPSNNAVRKQVRAALIGRQTESMSDLKRFLNLHRKKDPEVEFNQYISFALCLEGPPNFKFRIPESDFPPEVADLRGLEQILPHFWTENNLEALWRSVQPAYESTIEAYHAPVTKALLEANAYLRNPTSGYHGRRFQIFVDLLAAPNQIQTRNFKDDYFVVVTSSPELPIDRIQYSYIHYLIDPLALRYSDHLNRKKGLDDYTHQAPLLDEAYKNDYLLLTTASLAKAIQSRLAHGEQNRQSIVDQALRDGFVYTAAFADGLPAYEKQPESMRLYLPDLIEGIDLEKEDKRLAHVEFAHVSSAPKIHVQAPLPPELTGVEKTLETAEDFYRARELDSARDAYVKALEQTIQQPIQARAYYGLARIAALQRNPELAEKLFLKALELQPDPETKGWLYVYLGRLEAAAGEAVEAAKYYRAALTVEGASAKARGEAEKELNKSSGKEKE